MTIKEAITKAFEGRTRLKNQDLPLRVMKIKPDCCVHTIMRELRKMSYSKERKFKKDGTATNTYFYSLA